MNNLYQKLLNKGFKQVKYSNQPEPNVLYRIEFTDEVLMEKLIEELKEDKGYWDYRYDNMRISIEIREDLSFAQYAIAEQEINYGGLADGELSIEEFEQLIDNLDDVIELV